MRAALLLCACGALATSTAHAQDPATRGPLEVDEWDAGRVDAAGARIPTRVISPTAPGPHPLLGVIHGANRTGARHVELARTLASRGFVVVLPDLPCDFFGCDHDANAAQIIALLDWAVARSDDASAPIAGRVDGARRGLIGHSWGALASHLAASRDDRIDALVLLDPNDDGTVGLDATAGVTAPTLQLLAAVPGTCNAQWRPDAVAGRLPSPKLTLTVSGSGHCDPEMPGDSVCPFGCGAGDPGTALVFRRYAVAWAACLLTDDDAVRPWLGGASMAGDESGGAIEGVSADGLDALPCASAPPVEMDAGPPDADAGPRTRDGGRDDAGAEGPRDAGPGTADAGGGARDAGTGPDEGGGCGCRASRASPRGLPAVAAFALALLLTRTRRRAACGRGRPRPRP